MFQRAVFSFSVFADIFALRVATIVFRVIVRNGYRCFGRKRAAIDTQFIALPKGGRQIQIVSRRKQSKIVFDKHLPSVFFAKFFIVEITQIFIKTKLWSDKRKLAHRPSERIFVFALGQPFFKRIPSIFFAAAQNFAQIFLRRAVTSERHTFESSVARTAARR